MRDSAAVLAPNGLIYVMGGQTASGATATVESYTIATNTWSLETPLPQPLSAAAAAVDSLGRIEVLGGVDINGNALASTYVIQEFTQPDIAPTITSSPPTTGVLNDGYTYQVTSSANPKATYSLTTYHYNATGLLARFWTVAAMASGIAYTKPSDAASQRDSGFRARESSGSPTLEWVLRLCGK